MSEQLIHRSKLPSGFSMMEVLVAILIFSLGLLGVAGLMTVSMKTNHGAYLRSQAIFLAQSLADRMRSNSNGVWGPAGISSYAFTAANPVTATNQACDSSTACSPTQVATHDLYAWNQQLVDFLPPPPSGAPAVVACTLRTGAIAPNSTSLLQKPPYDGYCTITINWTESALNPSESNTAAATVLQTFTLAFQP